MIEATRESTKKKCKVAYDCRPKKLIFPKFQSRVSIKYATLVAPWLVSETPSGQRWSHSTNYQPTTVHGEQRPCAGDLIKKLNDCKYGA